jgi:hypothetical protein
MSLIETLAPQMAAYSKQFHTDGDVEWLPYVMFFHPRSYCSTVVSTDSSGFRFSKLDSDRFSVATSSELSSARLLAGNSVAFGIGASSDEATLASRMMVYDSRPQPWLNFGGRAFNSAQELILMTLYRHMLPKIDEIMLLSGANDLLLARLPEAYIQEHGAFFNCFRFFDDVRASSSKTAENCFSFSNLFGREKQSASLPDNALSMGERIEMAADLTLRHLDGWNAVAKDMGAKLTFILQPMSRWVRSKGCEEEEKLFAELASKRRYTTVRHDVLQRRVGDEYASMLETGTKRRGISFVDMNPAVRSAAGDDQWLFIDHTHLTDEGYDLLARLVIDFTQQSES